MPVEDVEQRPFVIIDDMIHPDFINLGLADNFLIVVVEDVYVDGGDVVSWGIPVDGVTGFCGEGDVVWVDGHGRYLPFQHVAAPREVLSGKAGLVV